MPWRWLDWRRFGCGIGLVGKECLDSETDRPSQLRFDASMVLARKLCGKVSQASRACQRGAWDQKRTFFGGLGQLG
jgi:hypothetical protein